VDAVVVPIGGGGLISGIAMAVKAANPGARVIGVESSDGPAMKRSVEAGRLVTLDSIDTIIDGLRVKRVGEKTFEVVRRFVDEIVTLPDRDIFDAVVWTMHYAKLVPEGAAASTVGALLHGLVTLAAGSKVVCVLSGGNLNLDQLRGLTWN
jgi:threonine dehydratase